MAKMIPDLDETQLASLRVKNVAEHDTYLALKEQLPDDWVVRYDYRFCLKSRNGSSADGQADFIALIPNQGLMFIEVKGPAGFECRAGQCFYQSDDGTLSKAPGDPFEQAQSNKHTIVKRLAEKLGVEKKWFPGRYGHMVAFPRAKTIGAKPASHEPQVILLYKDMKNWVASINAAFEVFGYEWIGPKFTPQVMTQVERILTDDLKLVPVMAAEMDWDDRVITALTQRQAEAYGAVLANTRVRVEGVAGSGKTCIALWAAREFAKQGKTMLFLCFNRMLAEWLKAGRGEKLGFEVWNFHRFAGHCCGRAKVAFDPKSFGEEAGFWKETAPILLCEALDALPDLRFDAVVVDEAQDFHVDWWAPVEMLLRDRDTSCLHIFLDSEQTLYGSGQGSIKMALKYHLTENCRNTRKITGYSGRVIDKNIPARPGAPQGIEPEIYPAVTNQSQRLKRVRSAVKAWLDEEIAPSRIAILSPWQRENPGSSLAGLDQVQGRPVLGGEQGLKAWLESKAILGETIKAFKGLEADCIVIADLPEPGTTGFDVADLYVAVSRAKHRLVLIPSSVAAEQRLKQWTAQA